MPGRQRVSQMQRMCQARKYHEVVLPVYMQALSNQQGLIILTPPPPPPGGPLPRIGHQLGGCGTVWLCL